MEPLKPMTREPLPLTDEEFHVLSKMIYDHTGILIKPSKKYLLESRLSERLNALGCENYRDYIFYLKRDDIHQEFQKLINVITNNETRFLRNFPQLKDFQTKLLPELVERNQAERRKLKIWCAGCSTGEEPYSLAMLISERFPSVVMGRQVEIIGSDINTEVIKIARKGVYTNSQLKHLAPQYLSRFFRQVDQGYEVTAMIKSVVRFELINLFDQYTVKRVIQQTDVIFFRNVMIYFGEEKRRQVISLMYDVLRPGGYLFLGHSESLHGISKAFKIRSLGKSLVYYKENLGLP